MRLLLRTKDNEVTTIIYWTYIEGDRSLLQLYWAQRMIVDTAYVLGSWIICLFNVDLKFIIVHRLWYWWPMHHCRLWHWWPMYHCRCDIGDPCTIAGVTLVTYACTNVSNILLMNHSIHHCAFKTNYIVRFSFSRMGGWVCRVDAVWCSHQRGTVFQSPTHTTVVTQFASMSYPPPLHEHWPLS